MQRAQQVDGDGARRLAPLGGGDAWRRAGRPTACRRASRCGRTRRGGCPSGRWARRPLPAPWAAGSVIAGGSRTALLVGRTWTRARSRGRTRIGSARRKRHARHSSVPDRRPERARVRLDGPARRRARAKRSSASRPPASTTSTSTIAPASTSCRSPSRRARRARAWWRRSGPDVEGLKGGDRVAYAMSIGSYAEHAVVPAWKLVPVPRAIDSRTAAALMLQGMTAHYLVNERLRAEGRRQPRSCTRPRAASAACSCRWPSSAARASSAPPPRRSSTSCASSGADAVDRLHDAGLRGGGHAPHRAAPASTSSTTAWGARPSTRASTALAVRGYLALYGQSSGPVPPVDPARLAKKGNFLTRPSLAHYAQTREELLWRAREVFAAVEAGTLRVRIDRELPLREAPEAHRLLEGAEDHRASCCCVPVTRPEPRGPVRRSAHRVRRDGPRRRTAAPPGGPRLAAHLAEPAARLPVLARGHDLVRRARDEVPPHEDGLPERRGRPGAARAGGGRPGRAGTPPRGRRRGNTACPAPAAGRRARSRDRSAAARARTCRRGARPCAARDRRRSPRRAAARTSFGAGRHLPHPAHDDGHAAAGHVHARTVAVVVEGGRHLAGARPAARARAGRRAAAPPRPPASPRNGRCRGRPSSGSASRERPAPPIPGCPGGATSPSKSQVSVCSPMCGCGGTSITFTPSWYTGPKTSMKHHGPTSRRSRRGRSRRTVMPPRSTVMGAISCRAGADGSPPQTSALLRPREVAHGRSFRVQASATPTRVSAAP